MVHKNAPDFSRYRVLLVEDIEINREIVLTLLKPTKAQVVCAENGQVAVELFARAPESFDLIFMDMHMPEMDGSEATLLIRGMEHPNARRVPIIAMTANVFREDIESCMEIGMNDHLGKPLDFDEVLQKMEKYLKSV